MNFTHAELVENIKYSAETGEFHWVKPGQGRQMGKSLGGAMANKYLQLKFKGEPTLAHRLAWFYTHGVWPSGVIDHINGDRQDNRLINLRDTTSSVNAQNVFKAHRDSRSGVLGVRSYKGSYRAHITVDKKVRHLGTFKTIEEASLAYKEAKRHYHPEASYGL